MAYCVLAGSYARHCRGGYDWFGVGTYVVLAALVMLHCFATRKLVGGEKPEGHDTKLQ